MNNEYTPWLELGLTELEYFKRRYLEARAESSLKQAVIAANFEEKRAMFTNWELAENALVKLRLQNDTLSAALTAAERYIAVLTHSGLMPDAMLTDKGETRRAWETAREKVA